MTSDIILLVVVLIGEQEREIRETGEIELESETGDMWGAFAIYRLIRFNT